MPDPITVVLRRGSLVEAAHRVHAVAVHDGAVVEAAGESELVTFMRSAAKPIQALPLVRARDDLDETEVAIASASHLADEDQLTAVARLLAKAGASENELECGPAGEPPSRLKHNCSGKHAAMLLLCRTKGWPTAGYRLAAHEVQRAMLHELAEAAELPPDQLETAVDGCGVVTFGLPLERMALAFARLESLEGGARIGAAMRARPELIRGERALDTRLMRLLPGWTAKGGAEGVLCAASPDGVGVALKAEDGAQRALEPALAVLLERLGHAVPELARPPVLNSRGESIGELVAQA